MNSNDEAERLQLCLQRQFNVVLGDGVDAACKPIDTVMSETDDCGLDGDYQEEWADEEALRAETEWQAKVDGKTADPRGVRVSAAERDRWLNWRCPGFELWAPKDDSRIYGGRTLFDDPALAAVDTELVERKAATP